MKYLLLILFLFFSFSNLYSAETYGNADRYDVTIKQIQICENATISSETSFSVSNCVTLGNSTLTVDIASASVGASLGKYADTTAMIQGRTYRYFVPTLGRTFVLTGGGSFTKLSDSSSGTCNTDEDATIASNSAHLTEKTGKVGGTATAATFYIPSATSSGVQCRNQDCSHSTGILTFSHDLPDTTSLYGNAINVPSTADDFSMIYTLTTPFTVGETVPIINMQFGTQNAIKINPLRDNRGNDTCNIGPYYPKFRVTVLNP